MGYVYRFFLSTRYSNTRVMKSVGNLNDLTSPPPRGILYQTSCIEAKTKSESLDDEKTSSSLASCMEEITKHVELLKQELEKPYTSTHCLKWVDLLFSDTSYVLGGSND
ncbi:hypothetical protein Bca4012_049930 [Brassica carinata]